jgi:hypothetical protein
MNVGTWIKKQIRTGSDFTPASRESKEIQKDLDDLAGRVDELKQPVEVSLEGSYDDLSTTEKLVLGAAGGAAVGGVLGAAHGMLSPVGDSLELDVDWVKRPILEHRMNLVPSRTRIEGLASQVTSEGIVEVSVQGGVRYDFRSEIVDEEIGTYKTPGEVELRRTPSSNPTVSGLIGLGVGAGLGLATTGAVMALKSFRGETGESKERELAGVSRSEIKTMAALGAVGAAGGAGVGALSGWLEGRRAADMTATLNWETPIMEEAVIGHKPPPASILTRMDLEFGNSLNGTTIFNDPTKFDLQDYMDGDTGEAVSRNNPKTGLLGGVEMDSQSRDYTADPNTNVMASALGGALVGGLVGVATGVCYNTLQRMIEA